MRMLDERQRRVVRLLAGGLAQTEIAVRIGVSTRQVSRLLSDAREIAGVETNQALVAWCYREERAGKC